MGELNGEEAVSAVSVAWKVAAGEFHRRSSQLGAGQHHLSRLNLGKDRGEEEGKVQGVFCQMSFKFWILNLNSVFH